MTRSAFRIRPVALGVVAIAALGCGKKGPPLAPLIIAPAAVADVSASRFGDRVIIRFTPPDKNTDNSTPADLSRVEIYALSVAGAAMAPDAGEIVREGAHLGTVEMAKGPASAGATDEVAGPRTFAETLTADARKTHETKRSKGWKGSTASTGSTGSTGSGSTGSGAAPVVEAPHPMRLYALVPISGRGRRGAASLATVPLAPAPAPPAPPAITYSETTISLTWLTVDGVKGYNVYERGRTGSTGSMGSTGSTSSTGSIGAPLNESPLSEPRFEDKRLEVGKTRCYSVTSVEVVEQRRIESPLSEPACVTPADTFAPTAPTGVAAVAGPGSISLIWDAVSATDLAGYVVLRGEAPGDTLQALTPEPIKETTFRDATVTPGTRYVYVVVAVDTSKNTSAQSARVEETAR